MKRLRAFLLMAVAAALLAACAPPSPPATNATNATNAANTATASKAAPTVDAVLTMEKAAFDAYIKADTKHFEDIMSDKFAMYEGTQKMDRAATLKMIGETKCDVKTWSLEEPKLTMIDPDTAVIVTKANFDGTCSGPDGKAMKLPSPTRSASVWTRGTGDKWMAAYHNEVPITASPKAMPPPPAANSNANTNTGSNSNTNTAAPAADPTVDAMIAIEKQGWDAWKARDAKKLEDMTTANLSFVDLFGNYTPTKADTIKAWTGSECDIKSVSVTDGTGQMLSPTLGMIHFKGTAEGTCGTQKLMPLWGTSFYVKEGNTWKLAFGFENPA